MSGILRIARQQMWTPGRGFVPARSSLYTGLVSAWKMDEQSGTRSDSYGSNNLTDNNAVSWILGHVGARAGSYNAASLQYLSLANNASLDFHASDFTLAVWFDLTLDNTPVIVCKGNVASAATVEWDLFWAGLGELRFRVGNGVVLPYASVTGLALNTWYLAICEHNHNTNTIGLRVNGGVKATAASSGMQASSGIFTFGRGGAASSNYVTGYIDNAYLWSRLLTTAEQDQLYNNLQDYPF